MLDSYPCADGRRTVRTVNKGKAEKGDACESHSGNDLNDAFALLARLTWAQRLRRVFDIAISTCPFCGGTLRVIRDARTANPFLRPP